MNRHPGPWIEGVALQLLFDTQAVRPGDLLWLHNSPGWTASKIVLVVEPRWWVGEREFVQVLCDAPGGSAYTTVSAGGPFRATWMQHVKAWCRPSLDLAL